MTAPEGTAPGQAATFEPWQAACIAFWATVEAGPDRGADTSAALAWAKSQGTVKAWKAAVTAAAAARPDLPELSGPLSATKEREHANERGNHGRGNPRQVLDLELGRNDSGKPTVRAYLVELLRKVWTEGEGFDGKRPFGNSGWDYDFVPAMVRAGIVKGKLDEDGYVEEADDRRLNALVLAAIESLGSVGCDEHGQLVADLVTERAELAGRLKRIRAIAERGADL